MWSPRGDLIAFTREAGGQFSIGVIKPDGSGERILTEGFHNEGPTWSPNGRIIMFFREQSGEGGPHLYTIDLTGYNQFQVATPGLRFGSGMVARRSTDRRLTVAALARLNMLGVARWVGSGGFVYSVNHVPEEPLNHAPASNRGMVDGELISMPKMMTIARLALVVGVALGLAACAKPGPVVAPICRSPAARRRLAAPRTSPSMSATASSSCVDSSDFTQEAVGTLNRQVQWLQQYPNYAFIIEGHADERGTREYNIALGARRASAVQAFFVSRGIAANRMRTISYGKERPVAVCDDISCWSQNRRAVIVLTNAGV